MKTGLTDALWGVIVLERPPGGRGDQVRARAGGHHLDLQGFVCGIARLKQSKRTLARGYAFQSMPRKLLDSVVGDGEERGPRTRLGVQLSKARPRDWLLPHLRL